MQNIKLTIAYDGQHYLGWQKTRMGSSIESTLQSIVEQILQHPIHLQAASRTDAGVHAEGQVVNFLTSKHPNLERLKISLNSLLPKDIAVLDAVFMEPTFHPTLHSTGKEYHYYLCYDNFQWPHHRFYSWHYPHSLDVERMRQASLSFIGTHNFASFCNFKKNAHYQDYIRTIENIEINEIGSKRLCIKIKGNHFLYKMVRNLVGTIVYIGAGKLYLEDIPAILQSADRTQAGVTAPAHGLFLHRVYYN